MKVLLVNPPQEFFDTYNEIAKGMAWFVPPLGLAYIAAVLEKEGIDVRIYDGQIQETLRFTELIRILKEMKPDVVGITSSTTTFNRTVAAAKAIKQENNVPIVIGGPHANALPVEILKEQKCFDFVVFGEGEYTMLELVQAIRDKKSFSNIKGVVYREGSKLIKNEPRQYIQNLDQLPFPARHLLPDIKKYNYVNFKRLPSAHLITSRGFPLILKKLPDVKFLVVGTGAYYNNVANLEEINLIGV